MNVRSILLSLALALAVAPQLGGCVIEEEATDEDDWQIPDGGFSNGEPLGKADSIGVPGPAVATNTSDTQVWNAVNKWEDRDTAAARTAGIAWDANSGLNWDEKYAKWIESMPRQHSVDYFDTFTITTPWGKTVPAPKLECSEMAMFLRITFAAWYELPYYLTAVDSQGTRVYFGHFGARTKTSRYANTPLYARSYKDYSGMSAAQLAQGWPQDAKLRARGLVPNDDDENMIAPGARAGAYFDEVHLNKRVGHFLILALDYFGSMNLADSRNMYNLKPESLREGDVLLERWQKEGIGHTLVVKEVKQLGAGQIEAQLASGSMPRRQPKWEDGTASKQYFTSDETGGKGQNWQGDAYAKLGGGIKRWRVTKNVNGYWTNTWMGGDEASWVNDSDYAAIAARPERFQTLLGEQSPEQVRDSLLQMIADARSHLAEYPGSCSARENREKAFDALYTVGQDKLGMSRAQIDNKYRKLEDYVFAELEYNKSKTCCWNSTTAGMFQIIMDYNNGLQKNACVKPVVFKASKNGGYDVFAQYAATSGKASLWKPWHEDEPCAQRDVQDDTIATLNVTEYCSL